MVFYYRAPNVVLLPHDEINHAPAIYLVSPRHRFRFRGTHSRVSAAAFRNLGFRIRRTLPGDGGSNTEDQPRNPRCGVPPGGIRNAPHELRKEGYQVEGTQCFQSSQL